MNKNSLDDTQETKHAKSEARAAKRLARAGEVKKITGELEIEALTKQQEAHNNQRKWLDSMQDELRKGEK